ncbi:hypothetical protein ACP4OV_028451 [Aristida adscensionis]
MLLLPRYGAALGPLPPPPSRRRPCGGSDGVDRISGLPDDLLLHTLARLRCARAAVRAAVLSRRWLGLWRRLPELYLRNVAPATLEATLAQVALPKLSLLHVDDFFYYPHPPPPRSPPLSPRRCSAPRRAWIQWSSA